MPVEVRQFEMNFVPGHLQTERTMRMLFARNPDFDEDEMDSCLPRLRAQCRSGRRPRPAIRFPSQ